MSGILPGLIASTLLVKKLKHCTNHSFIISLMHLYDENTGAVELLSKEPWIFTLIWKRFSYISFSFLLLNETMEKMILLAKKYQNNNLLFVQPGQKDVQVLPRTRVLLDDEIPLLYFVSIMDPMDSFSFHLKYSKYIHIYMIAVLFFINLYIIS